MALSVNQKKILNRVMGRVFGNFGVHDLPAFTDIVGSGGGAPSFEGLLLKDDSAPTINNGGLLLHLAITPGVIYGTPASATYPTAAIDLGVQIDALTTKPVPNDSVVRVRIYAVATNWGTNSVQFMAFAGDSLENFSANTEAQAALQAGASFESLLAPPALATVLAWRDNVAQSDPAMKVGSVVLLADVVYFRGVTWMEMAPDAIDGTGYNLSVRSVVA